ncbi:glycoprotein hormone alpha-2 precursor, partial [Silurus meridionalis]
FACVADVMLLVLLTVLLITFSWSSNGLGPGCHFYCVWLTHTKRGMCKGAHMVYACVGYCDSSAFSLCYSVLPTFNFMHNITSVSCCSTIGKAIKKLRCH